MKYEVKLRGSKDNIIISQEQGEKLKELVGGRNFQEYVEFGLHKVKLSMVEGVFPIYEQDYESQEPPHKRTPEGEEKLNQTLKSIGDLLREKKIIK